jgi:hypothetical protein
MNTTYKTIDKLIKITRSKNLRHLSEKLDINYNTLRNRCSRDSMPYKEILIYCYDNDIDINDLLFE